MNTFRGSGTGFIDSILNPDSDGSNDHPMPDLTENQEEEKSSILGSLKGLMSVSTGIVNFLGIGDGLNIESELLFVFVALPVMLAFTVFPLATMALAMLAFPVPQFQIPVGRSFSGVSNTLLEKARGVMQSEECIERLSCGLGSSMSGPIPFEQWITS